MNGECKAVATTTKHGFVRAGYLVTFTSTEGKLNSRRRSTDVAANSAHLSPLQGREKVADGRMADPYLRSFTVRVLLGLTCDHGLRPPAKAAPPFGQPTAGSRAILLRSRQRTTSRFWRSGVADGSNSGSEERIVLGVTGSGPPRRAACPVGGRIRELAMS